MAGAVEYPDCIFVEEKDPHPNKCPGYDTKSSYSEAQILEFWGMWSTPSLSLHSGPLWPGVVVLVRVPSRGQIEIFNHFLLLKPFNSEQTNDRC